jgi:predicted nucleotidyltransferase
MPSLLQEYADIRARSAERLRLEVKAEMQALLRELLPGVPIMVFGSLTKPGKFSEYSDVDIALETEPPGMSVYQLSSLLAERLGRPVDVLLLPECRFRERIIREGEQWTLSD